MDPAEIQPVDEMPTTTAESVPKPPPPVVITADMLAPDVLDPRRGRIDFERGMSYWPLLTLILIAANVAVFIWQLLTGSLESAEDIIRSGALHRDSLLAGEYWRLVTPMFLHADFEHLIGNCAMLYIMGVGLEHAVGPRQSGLAYFL